MTKSMAMPTPQLTSTGLGFGGSAAGDAAAIDLVGLTKTFGRIQALRGVDLTVAQGEVVAFLGPNGAGKSTAIDLMLGLTKPDTGNARLFGGDPVAAVRAGRVGAMLQSGALLPDLTVRQLVSMFAGLHHHPLTIGEAIERAGIADIAGQKTTKLSGGQAQRVRFALALVPDPDLLVLDEPTVAMDVELRRSFWATMRGAASAGKTVIFATHYLEEADDFADRIVVLAHGQIVADGTGAQIKAAVAGRIISAQIPDPAGPAGSASSRTTLQQGLAALPGVQRVERQGPRYVLRCTDSDQALRALLAAYPAGRDIEVRAANLEDAFLQLTGGSK